jgi:hypothetical protein
MQHTASTADKRQEHIVGKRLLWATLLTAIAATVANALIYVIADWLGAFPNDVHISGGEPLGVSLVIIGSVSGAVGAGIAFAIIERFASQPVRLFRIVAVVALILSFATPFTIADAPADMIASLILMHIVVAAASIGLLPRLAPER